MTRLGLLFTGALLVAIGLVAVSRFRAADASAGTGSRAPMLRATPVPDSVMRLLSNAGVSVGPTAVRPAIIVVGDYECSYCNRLDRDAAAAWRASADRGVLQYRYVHGPLRVHRRGPDAAAAAYCAAAQDRAWQYHRRLYDHVFDWNHGRPARPRFLALASVAGLDTVRFAACLSAAGTRRKVEGDAKAAAALAAGFVPAVIVDGLLLESGTPDQLASYVAARRPGALTQVRARP